MRDELRVPAVDGVGVAPDDRELFRLVVGVERAAAAQIEQVQRVSSVGNSPAMARMFLPQWQRTSMVEGVLVLIAGMVWKGHARVAMSGSPRESVKDFASHVRRGRATRSCPTRAVGPRGRIALSHLGSVSTLSLHPDVDASLLHDSGGRGRP
jgi:hypothetical protein